VLFQSLERGRFQGLRRCGKSLDETSGQNRAVRGQVERRELVEHGFGHPELLVQPCRRRISCVGDPCGGRGSDVVSARSWRAEPHVLETAECGTRAGVGLRCRGDRVRDEQ